jgi:RNA polymerase sigma factor (sigma-70 family)
MATKTGKYRQRFPVEYDPSMEKSDYDVKRHEMQRDASAEAVREILEANIANLSDIERTIVRERFAVNGGKVVKGKLKGKTLKEVGEIVGLTNERVRQIQKLALHKLRGVLEADYLTV